MHLCHRHTHGSARYAPAMPRGMRGTASGKVTCVDTRRLVPRTDVLLADPRLAEAERKLGRALVKAAVARAQDQARAGTMED